MNRAGFLSAFGASVALASRAAHAQRPLSAGVMLGDEVFLDETWRELGGRCIGIVTNQTGATSHRVHIVDAVRRNPQICVKALFAPEHGLRGEHGAGAYVPSYT
ncbi:MAG: exo-beta-N-acetylmuramidase NamZ domain-containing protein, partial [Polyangiaceae bacterium]